MEPADAALELAALRRVELAARAYIVSKLRAASAIELHSHHQALVDALDAVPWRSPESVEYQARGY